MKDDFSLYGVSKCTLCLAHYRNKNIRQIVELNEDLPSFIQYLWNVVVALWTFGGNMDSASRAKLSHLFDKESFVWKDATSEAIEASLDTLHFIEDSWSEASWQMTSVIHLLQQ